MDDKPQALSELDKFGRDPDSFYASRTKFNTALNFNLYQEPTPYLHRTAISKGTIAANLKGATGAGGRVDFKDVTGGTSIITYDPATGTVTINGGIVVNQTLVGTLNNGAVSGTTSISGTLTSTGMYTGGTLSSFTGSQGTFNNGIIGTPAITGGTTNAGTYQVGGTGGITGSIVYVKTVNFAGSSTTLGTVQFVSGLITVAN